ncbi:hypothetical protein GCM10015535_28610 [Streptomyces gelaticus]|uniref:Guanylate cyclase domain-containing protein n=1 Tax=Streptomyces gelaticus TaxID=285446 RepID=A0ABQ2VXN4_9ACTN|nr:hypothetical protein [Streptomyces gelaticus]GGV84250.1 hypothetical protein GCM10015535_28610 [Streptomyces gelaticus]
MNDPVNSTILLLDIEKYSERDDVEQAYLRRMLYDLTDRALLAAGIDETRRRRADRGDSVMELIDANCSVIALLRALLTEVPARLRSQNRRASATARMRLRGVVASGYVAVDPLDGWVGSDLNHACRLLDADALRSALRARPDDFALCVSDAVYQGVVRHSHTGVPAEEFRSVTVESKNGPLDAWLHGPLPEECPQAPDVVPDVVPAALRSPVPAPGPGGAPVNGGVFGGTNHGIGGGVFHGEVRLGDGGRGDRR